MLKRIKISIASLAMAWIHLRLRLQVASQSLCPVDGFSQSMHAAGQCCSSLTSSPMTAMNWRSLYSDAGAAIFARCRSQSSGYRFNDAARSSLPADITGARTTLASGLR